MHMQMLSSPLRVLTPEEADVVYALLSPAQQPQPRLPASQTHVTASHYSQWL